MQEYSLTYNFRLSGLQPNEPESMSENKDYVQHHN